MSKNSNFKTLNPSDFSAYNLSNLLEIPEPPKQLWIQGKMPPENLKLLAVVGSRKYTSYGKQVLEHLISGLKNYPVGIVSGLALGIDSLAHEIALKNNLYTLAVPGSGLDFSVLYPARNKGLAERIVGSGGGLLSELSPLSAAAPWTFPKRNRLMAGLCPATILIEAGEKSGTLITARLAVDYNRELLAVPGSIFFKNSFGVHQFLKLGATLVTEASDILAVLKIDEKITEKEKPKPQLSIEAEKVISLLFEPKEKDILIRELNQKFNLSVSEVNILLMELEMQGVISYDSPIYRSLV